MFSAWSERAEERWKGERFEFVRRMGQIFSGRGKTDKEGSRAAGQGNRACKGMQDRCPLIIFRDVK